MIYNLGRLSSVMDSQGLDMLLVSTRENINYFTGIRPVVKELNPYYGECYVLICRQQPDIVHFVHSCGECDQLTESRTPIGLVHTYGTFYRELPDQSLLRDDEVAIHRWTSNSARHLNAQQALLTLLQELGVTPSTRIGCDEDGVSHAALASMQAQFGEASIILASALIRQIRRVKTPYEIEMLTLAARCNESAIKCVAEAVQVGISELQIGEIFESAVVRLGGRPELTMIKIGRAAVGGQRRQRADITLQHGDLLWFDSNTRYQGFWADLARVYAFGDVAPATAQRYAALREGMLHAARSIRPGMSGKDVFHLTMDCVRSNGFPEYRRHHVGHGIGHEAYERPILMPGEDALVEQGMVISIETPYYEFGLGALHLEDPLVIGPELNTFLTMDPCPELGVIATSSFR
ncbi:aminopeptidase P family protein [Pseudomonas chlororaphis]|uniref:M24 family metallopeptidase n=1 Tax=Pseudomonas chlororaphis TaxID=587753 RepID=UPI001B33B053|nr:Xaa-Pro peptidase family protein [Pseudomonas chlororaphis]MBP5077265.1 aminopeptidase P family protein [Pseudomonas chlororaphis]